MFPISDINDDDVVLDNLHRRVRCDNRPSVFRFDAVLCSTKSEYQQVNKRHPTWKLAFYAAPTKLQAYEYSLGGPNDSLHAKVRGQQVHVCRSCKHEGGDHHESVLDPDEQPIDLMLVIPERVCS